LKNNAVIRVEKNSIAEELDIEKGDLLIDIDGRKIIDVFDYRYALKSEYVELHILKSNGEDIIYEIEKGYDEDLGIEFASGLLDSAKTCKNRCIFCFVDQLPSGMRRSLYFKDDDSRLSFINGNYCTLTNVTDEDLERIIFYRLPVNVSVHATDPHLRAFILGTIDASTLGSRLEKLAAAGIKMNFQIVLCKGVNDGKRLSETLKDLLIYNPENICVVPVGLTKFRSRLFKLEPFLKDDCSKVIDEIDDFKRRYKIRVFPSDEFYLAAGREIPPAEFYGDFSQLENGVGMCALFKKEFPEYIKNYGGFSIVTGCLAFDLVESVIKKYSFDNKVYKIKNDFFGETITVSGLLTGRDIVAQLKNENLGKGIILPRNCLKAGENILLDDVRTSDIAKALNAKVIIGA
jgi:putative radical SAM enzyme (TIGR03279 family)